jgi:hypothetical protein
VDPIVSAIMTGHLLVEEQLWQVVRESVANPSALDDARLSFVQLVAMADAVAKDSSLKSCWRLVRRLNALRNRCAHQVEPARLEVELRGFIDDVRNERMPGTKGEAVTVTAHNVITAIGLIWLWIDPSPTFASKEIEDDPMWK